MKRSKTIAEALQYVADHPTPSNVPPIDVPIWELMARKVFEIANSPDPAVRGSLGRATAAQKILLDRLVGRRRPGTHPAQASTEQLEFVDLTVGVLPEPEEESDGLVAGTDAEAGRETGGGR